MFLNFLLILLRFPEAIAWQQRLILQCRQVGFVESLLHRRRSFPEILSKKVVESVAFSFSFISILKITHDSNKISPPIRNAFESMQRDQPSILWYKLLLLIYGIDLKVLQ